MKKVISILLVLVMALSLCACGNNNDKYVGTYVGHWSYVFYHLLPQSEKYADAYNANIEGIFTYVLNSDNTGTVTFAAKKLFGGENVEMFNCPITWEVVDDYIYITGSCESIYEEKLINIDERFVLDGKELWNGLEYGSRFRKQ